MTECDKRNSHISSKLQVYYLQTVEAVGVSYQLLYRAVANTRRQKIGKIPSGFHAEGKPTLERRQHDSY
jgi:hypothetical protein